MEPLFDAGTLAEARAFNDVNLPETFTVKTKGSFTPNGTGGSYAEVDTVVPCRVSPLGDTQTEQAIAEAETGVTLLRLATARGSALGLNATGTLRGERWEVIGVIPDPSYAMQSRYVVRRAA